MAKKKIEDYLLVLLRLGMGWIFLWAFFDKVFGLGFATEAGKGWIKGVSPTYGFLNFAVKGPFAGLYKSMAGSVFVDWLFMIGLLLIGLSLLLGVGQKIAGYSGALMMFLMWTTVLLPEHNPFLDDHIIYGLVLILLAHVKTKFSLGDWWRKTKLVKKYGFLE